MTENYDWLIWALFSRLRRYKFPLGQEDYEALWLAMRAGYGWESLRDLRKVCGALWAKSLQEQEVVYALFDQIVEQSEVDYSWKIERPLDAPDLQQADAKPKHLDDEDAKKTDSQKEPSLELEESKQGLPPIYIDPDDIPRRPLVFLPQYPVSYREVAQAFRRLRKPIRKGPKVVLDVDATIELRSRQGVISPAFMVPHRINTFRLVLLVDRYGSMLPFHNFINQVVLALVQSARLESVSTFYFHDSPVVGDDYSLLKPYTSELMPSLDKIMPDIQPSHNGQIFQDAELTQPQEFTDVLNDYVSGALVVIISDAGAARGDYDLARLFDTISLIKSLKKYTPDYVWINPLEQRYWGNSTAGKIARHLPMFTLDVPGMFKAVNVLRGQPFFVERPV